MRRVVHWPRRQLHAQVRPHRKPIACSVSARRPKERYAETGAQTVPPLRNSRLETTYPMLLPLHPRHDRGEAGISAYWLQIGIGR
jgi:hypothetical protein